MLEEDQVAEVSWAAAASEAARAAAAAAAVRGHMPAAPPRLSPDEVRDAAQTLHQLARSLTAIDETLKVIAAAARGWPADPQVWEVDARARANAGLVQVRCSSAARRISHIAHAIADAETAALRLASAASVEFLD